MKRRQEVDPSGDDRSKRGKGEKVTMPFVLKFLAPEAMASAVIGKGGAVIASMRQSAQAKIGLTEHNELYPGTTCRVLTAQANTEESLVEVSRQIIGKIADCVQAGPSEELGQPGDLRLRTLMPRYAVGGLIGKGGAAIRQLREMSNAKISVSEAAGPGPGAEQTVSVNGSQQALEYVMAEVNRQVQTVSKEDWFKAWASQPGVVASSNADRGARNGHGYSHQQPVHVPPPGAGHAAHAASPGHQGDGLDMMVNVAQGLPQYVMEDARGFAMSCVVPNRLVGGLIGRGGAGTKEVQQITGTKIGIREIPGDPENRSLNIAGPLAHTCAAYMLMMRRYLDSEAQAALPPQGDARRRS